MTLDTKVMAKIIATTSDRLKDLTIKDGQLVFVYDKGRLAMDYKGERVFYNQIIELAKDVDRISIESPIDGKYYFVIETACLWYYSGKWIKVTSTGGDTVFICDELPELGSAGKVYVDKTNKSISIWDDMTREYVVVADKTNIVNIADEDINKLFP